MRKYDILLGLAFMLAGLVFLVGGLRLGVGSPTSDGVPGPGFFPVILAGVVMLLGGLLVLKALGTRDDAPSPFRLEGECRANKRPFVLTLLGVAGFLVLWRFSPLKWFDAWAAEGFYVSDHAFNLAAFLFCIYLNRVYGRSWRFTAVFSICVVAAVHICFNQMLFIQFNI